MVVVCGGCRGGGDMWLVVVACGGVCVVVVFPGVWCVVVVCGGGVSVCVWMCVCVCLDVCVF